MKKIYFMALAFMGSVSSFAQLADGDYVIKNVESGKYLNGGNSWGTKVSVTEHAQFMTLAVSEGKYSIKSHYSNGGGKDYVAAGDNTYLDAAVAYHSIEAVEGGYSIMDANGKYLVSDGNVANFNGEAAQVWQIISKEQYIADAVAQAKAGNPADLTGLVPDANFSRNNTDFNLWVGESKMGKGGPNNAMDATATGMNAEKWGGNSTSIDFGTTVSGLPNGKYQINFQGFYRYNNTTANTNDVAAAAHADGTEKINSYFIANGVKTPFVSIADEASVEVYGKMPFSQAEASEAFTKGAYKNGAEIEVTDGTLSLKVEKLESDHEGCDWTILDNIELTYVAPFVNTIAAGKYTINANVALADGVTIDMVPAAFKDYVGNYKTTATIAGDEYTLAITENAEGGLFGSFEISGDRVALSADKTITLGGKVFTVRTANESETGSLAITATENGYTMESASVYYNGQKVATVSDITIAAVPCELTNISIAEGDMAYSASDGYDVADLTYDFNLYDADVMFTYGSIYYDVLDAEGNKIEGASGWTSYEPEDGARTISVKNIEAGKTYTLNVTSMTVGTMDKMTWDDITLLEVTENLPSITFTVPVAPKDCALTADMFHKWNGYDENATVAEENGGSAFELNASTGLVYGTGSVWGLNYADLTDYAYLVITSTEGTPRCMFNRPGDDGAMPVETPRDTKYFEESEKDGVKTTIVDLAAIKAEYGYVHLQAIKGANRANVTVTSMELYVNSLPTSISAVAATAEGTIESIYSVNGAKLATMQKGLNIVRYSNGATKKIMVK